MRVWGGYFYGYQGMTVRQIGDSVFPNVGAHNQFNQYFYMGQVDTEPDIFSFNLPTGGGKFWWNQQLSKFVVTPYNNIKVAYDNGVFTLTDETGNTYLFSVYETSALGGGEPTPSTWMVSNIHNADRTDSLVFSYQSENQLNTIMNPVTKYIWGVPCAGPEPLTSTLATKALTPDRISFSSGYVQFNKSGTPRQDLSGAYHLDNIKVFSDGNELVKRVDFDYGYRVTDPADPLSKRLLLAAVAESGSDPAQQQRHRFLYDSSIVAPPRTSAAQDFWGYYNGQTGNANLVPTTIVNLPQAGNTRINGADRHVRSEYAQFAILKRIVYPTGGHTDFEFENNMGYNNDIPAVQVNQGAVLEGEGTTPTATAYARTFTVNNPPDHYLNGGLGGAFAKVDFGDLGCTLNGTGNVCAQLKLRGLDAANATVNVSFNLPQSSFYLPNGNYEMTATFDQSPPAYNDFFYSIVWKGPDSAFLTNRPIGGLRIKAIRTYDGVGNTMTRKYRYTTGPGSDTSSGNIFGSPYFIGTDQYACWRVSIGYNQLYRVTSGTNAPSVTHSGSFVGYKRVYEFIDSAGAAGMNEYNFSEAKDIQQHYSPFPPAYSMAEYRGLPTENVVYRKQGAQYLPVSRTRFEYERKSFDSLAAYSLKMKLSEEPEVQNGTFYTTPVYDHSFYEVTPQWAQLSKKTEMLYDQVDTTLSLQTITHYGYGRPHYQLSTSRSIDSRQDELLTRLQYPADTVLSGTAETARLGLMAQNRVGTVLRKEQLKNGSPLEAVDTRYAKWGVTDIIRPSEIYQRLGGGSWESKIQFLDYTPQGMLGAQRKTGDLPTAYIWDYNGAHLTAECANALATHIAATSFEADGKGHWDYAGHAVVADATAPTGKKAYLLGTGATLTKGQLDPSVTYTVSYWSNAGPQTLSVPGAPVAGRTVNGWTYYEHTVSGASAVTLSGPGRVDEVRLYPKNAQMITYTHEPLLGMTSQCGADNRIVYYGYDAAGRLALVRDGDGKIVKRICYSYNGQVQDCGN
jgi:hypothetical protein